MSETAGEVGKSIEIKNTGDFLLKPDFQWNTATLNSVGSESLYPSHVLETALQARLPSPLAALNMTAPEFLPERKHRNGRNYSVEGKNGERDGHFGQENKLAGGDRATDEACQQRLGELKDMFGAWAMPVNTLQDFLRLRAVTVAN
ncbi:hypothetical protein AAMO2058_001190900 [Amorphochlora amoebiformis]